MYGGGSDGGRGGGGVVVTRLREPSGCSSRRIDIMAIHGKEGLRFVQNKRMTLSLGSWSNEFLSDHGCRHERNALVMSNVNVLFCFVFFFSEEEKRRTSTESSSALLLTHLLVISRAIMRCKTDAPRWAHFPGFVCVSFVLGTRDNKNCLGPIKCSVSIPGCCIQHYSAPR